MRQAVISVTRPAVVCAALVACVLAVTGCSSEPERSAEAYCTAFYEKAAPIREGYVEAGETVEENPLRAFARLMQAPGDFVVILDGMVDHAPDEIRSDTEAMRDSLKKQTEAAGDAIGDPLGAIGAGLVNALATSGSYGRVDAYLNEHCPVDSELAQRIIKNS